MRDLDQISQPGHAERARTPHSIAPAGLRGGRVLGHIAQCATVLGLSVFRCAMLAFIRDLFMTSYKWPNPVTLNALGMDNGFAPSRFRAQCTGPPHTVRHSAGVM